MKSLLFKLRQFPHLSETFVIAQIITAIDAGFSVTILVDELLDFKKSTHLDQISSYRIDEKILIENYKIPKNKTHRLLKACGIILRNLTRIRQLQKFIACKKKFSLSWIYQFQFYLQFKDFDIYHVQYGTTSKPLDILKMVGLLQGRLIVSFHGHDAFFPINGFIPKKGYYKWLFRGDNIMIANTPYLADKLKEIDCSEENIQIVPVGVDTSFFNSDNSSITKNDKLRIITVGRLDPIKGHEYAIDVINILKHRGLNVQFYIVGEGERRSYLENKIEKLNLKDSVFLLGSKSQQQVKYYLQGSDVFLFTSVHLKDGRRETQGLATLEAQACGLPIVAFDSGGIKYTFKDGENGFLCNEFDVNCLADHIEKLTDEVLRTKMRKKSLEFVNENFSQVKIDLIWKEIYYGTR